MIAPPNLSADVLVWGGGTGGIAAALQAARGGAATLLLTPGGWLGGMVSSAGVCCPDGNELSPWQTGLWGALLRELQQDQPARIGALSHCDLHSLLRHSLRVRQIELIGMD
jgi:anaerobic glycerol-3-phosphate dehydrogenase